MKLLLFYIVLFLRLIGFCLADDDTNVLEYYGASFRIPAPEGFERFDKTYPQLAEQIRRRMGITSDLLAAYGKAQELLDRDSGKSTHLKTLFYVTASKSLRSVDVTPELFSQIKLQLKSSGSDFQGMADKAAEVVNDYLQKQRNPADALKLKEPHPIGTFDERPSSICLLFISKVKLTTNGTAEDFSV